jgi:hypothetical protein
MDERHGYFVHGDAPEGFVEAMRNSPQMLKRWCEKQSIGVLRQAKFVLHTYHSVWHNVLKEEIDAREAAHERVANARMVRLTAWGVAVGLLAIVVGIIVSTLGH